MALQRAHAVASEQILLRLGSAERHIDAVLDVQVQGGRLSARWAGDIYPRPH